MGNESEENSGFGDRLQRMIESARSRVPSLEQLERAKTAPSVPEKPVDPSVAGIEAYIGTPDQHRDDAKDAEKARGESKPQPDTSSAG